MRLEINRFSSEEKTEVCLCYLQTAKCTVFAQPSFQETEPLTACVSTPSSNCSFIENSSLRVSEGDQDEQGWEHNKDKRLKVGILKPQVGIVRNTRKT